MISVTKIKLRARFYIADFGPFGWGKSRWKLGRKNHDGKSMDFANAFYISLFRDCFMKFRPEIVEIVGDSYDSKRSQLKAVAFKGTFEHARTGSSTFDIDSGRKV